MKTTICMILMACLLMGCTTDFVEVQKSELGNVFIMNSSPTFQGYFYLGSDKTNHYFTSKWKYETDRRFRVPKSDLLLSKEEPFGQREIPIFIYKPTIFEPDEFCVIGETRIYRGK